MQPIFPLYLYILNQDLKLKDAAAIRFKIWVVGSRVVFTVEISKIRAKCDLAIIR